MRVQLPERFEGVVIGGQRVNLGMPDAENCVDAPDNVIDLLLERGAKPMMTVIDVSLTKEVVASDETARERRDQTLTRRAKKPHR